MTKVMRTLLVDDEPLALKGLKLRLETKEGVEVIGTCANGREAIRAVKEQNPDLVFLDIQMPGLNGFAVLRALLGTEHMPLIVFVTAFDRYAIDAFEAHALDYLLKPVDDERIEEALHHARTRLAERHAVEQNARLTKMLDQMEGENKAALKAVLDGSGDDISKNRFPDQLHIKDRGKISFVNVNDVDYIDAAGDYLCIHVGDETHILRETMKTMEKKLDPAKFQRIHRSAIINLDRISEVVPHSNGECFLKLSSGAELKVSRSYKAVVARFL